MTFVCMGASIGLAMNQIREGNSVINTQLAVGYESDNGLKKAFSRHFGTAPSIATNQFILYASWIDTILGPMVAMSSESALYLLEFVDTRALDREIERLKKKTKAVILPGKTSANASIEQELTDYFNGELNHFKTPVVLLGSPFQHKVWDELKKIPAGETRSYLDIAKSIGQPSACRAVAGANGANQLAILIPCHRVINENGQLGGYAGGIARKEWLLNMEKAAVYQTQ